MTRAVDAKYRDPLEEVWTRTAQALGLKVARSADAYASTDGAGTLTVSDRSGMDADDCLAQMILHEICHFLVAGPSSIHFIDWGLDNEGTRDEVLEHATLRLQAALLEPLGLRRVLAPTTDFRAYYDALPPDPFSERDPAEREAIIRARAGFFRRLQRPCHPHLEQALAATRDLIQAAAPFVAQDSLLARAEPPAEPHPAGFFLHPDLRPRRTHGSATPDPPVPRALASAGPALARCSRCAWAYRTGLSRPVLRCVQADGKRVQADWPACERFEHDVDCLTCGACCREAYDTVEVGQNDPARRKHLSLLVERHGGYDMRRLGPRCICLRGGIELRVLTPAIAPAASPSRDEKDAPAPRMMPGAEPFTCEIYETRPRTCRDFTLRRENCLQARRLVGLSRS